MTLVTVVTPAFNAGEFIEEAARSVHAQTHRPIEHIVVDDASTDTTAALVERLAAEMTAEGYQLRLVRHSSNRGAAAALVKGVSEARGDAICWLSADDAFVQQGKTANQLAMLSDVDVVFDTQFLTGGSVGEAQVVHARWPLAMQLSRDLRSYDPEGLMVGLLMANPINGSSILMRRRIFDELAGFDLALGNVDADGDLWLRLCALGVRMKPRAETGIFYRLHAGQTSNRKSEMDDGTTLTRLRIIQALDDRDLLVPLLQRHATALGLAVLSRQHRAWPDVTAALAQLVSLHSERPARWARAATWDLGRRNLLDPARQEDVGRRARDLHGTEEFQRFLRQLPG